MIFVTTLCKRKIEWTGNKQFILKCSDHDVSMLFAELLFLHLVTYILNVSKSCLCHFFSSRCMLELKFGIYHRAASLSSQASSVDVCSISWRIIDQAPFKHWVNNGWQRLDLRLHAHNHISSAILNNNCVVTKWFVRMRTSEENGIIGIVNQERMKRTTFWPSLVWYLSDAFLCHWVCSPSWKHSVPCYKC